MDNFANQHKLKEGEVYSLKILKQIDFENEGFYVLETPLKTRITIPSEPYKNYSFKIGEEIRCKVDKISCSGKIYLEPEHPMYKIGDIYPFDFLESKQLESLYDGYIEVIYFIDKFCNLIEIPAWDSFNMKSKSFDLKIFRIKKAQIYAFPIHSPFITNYHDNQNLVLTFLNKFKNRYGEIEYLVSDQFGTWSLIPAKYFSTIQISKGQKLNALAVKHPTNDFFYIEPEHPKYKNGQIYPFIIVDVTVNNENLNKDQLPEVVFTLKDEIFDNYKLVTFCDNHPKIGETIMLITLGIRKGVLHLQIPK